MFFSFERLISIATGYLLCHFGNRTNALTQTMFI